MIKETCIKGVLLDSLRRAVISLLYKKNDKCLLKNYRPIGLTNYDYKIIAFVLAQKLQGVIGNLISHDQSAYIKKCYIGYNAKFISDIIDYTDLFNKPGFFIKSRF